MVAFLERQEIIQLRNVKPLVGEQREALNIPPSKRIDHVEPPNFYKPASTAIIEVPNDAATNPTLPDAADENQKGDSDEGELRTISHMDTGKEYVSESSKEGADTLVSDDTKDDDSTEPVGKDEASKLDQDLMMDDDEEDEKQETAQEAEVKSTTVTTMFQKILSLGGAGHVVVDVGSDMQPGLDHPAANSGPNARQPTVVYQGRKVSAIQFDVGGALPFSRLLSGSSHPCLGLQFTRASNTCWCNSNCCSFDWTSSDRCKCWRF
jgi:hypothetical protein